MPPDALVLALVAAGTGALGAVFQSRGAKSVRPARRSITAFVTAFARSRVWLAGAAMAGVSGLFHALALHVGSLVEVEAIMVTSLLFALGLGIVLTRSPVSRRDWLGAAATIVGLVVFLVIADPSDGDYSVSLGVWLVVTAVLMAIIAGLALTAVRSTVPNRRATLHATAAAVCLGAAAVVLKVITEMLGDSVAWGDLVAHLAALALLEAAALVFQQLAFRAGDLAAALAPFVGGNPLVAGALGMILFGERFHHDPADLAGSAAGIALVVGGILVLASSPLVAAGTGEDVAPAGLR